MAPSKKTYKTQAVSRTAADGHWETITIKRNAVGDDDIEFDIKYCGICHSDVHLASGKLKLYDDVVVPLATLADGVKYPLVFGKAYKSQPTFHNVSHKVKN